MRRWMIVLALGAAFVAVNVPAASAGGVITPKPMCAIDDNGNCISGPCSIDDVPCVLANSTYGYFETDVSSTPDSYGVDLFGSGAICRWVAIRDYWYSSPFSYNTFLGVFQAYICRRAGKVTRFEQMSAFGEDRVRFPDSLMYHIEWGLSTPPTSPGALPSNSTSSTTVLGVKVCALWNGVTCGGTKYLRYLIAATGSG